MRERVSEWMREILTDRSIQWLSDSVSAWLVDWVKEWVSAWVNEWVRKLASSKSDSWPVYKEQRTNILVIGKIGKKRPLDNFIRHIEALQSCPAEDQGCYIFYYRHINCCLMVEAGGIFRLQWSWFAYTWLCSFVGFCSNSFCCNWLRSWSFIIAVIIESEIIRFLNTYKSRNFEKRQIMRLLKGRAKLRQCY